MCVTSKLHWCTLHFPLASAIGAKGIFVLLEDVSFIGRIVRIYQYSLPRKRILKEKIVPNVETTDAFALGWILMVYLSVLLAGKGKNRKFQCDFSIRYKKWFYIDEYQEKSDYGRLGLYRCFYIRIDYIGWFRFIKT